jgi:hypothetical protein
MKCQSGSSKKVPPRSCFFLGGGNFLGSRGGRLQLGFPFRSGMITNVLLESLILDNPLQLPSLISSAYVICSKYTYIHTYIFLGFLYSTSYSYVYFDLLQVVWFLEAVVGLCAPRGLAFITHHDASRCLEIFSTAFV